LALFEVIAETEVVALNAVTALYEVFALVAVIALSDVDALFTLIDVLVNAVPVETLMTCFFESICICFMNLPSVAEPTVFADVDGA
jgi:hypothetical protein